MINTYYQVPEVYYKESRDFQLLGHIYDIIFNYLKTSIDTIYHTPLDKSIDKNLLDLLSCTLGFEIRHNYNINQLLSLCSSFSKIIKNKGTKKAIELAVYSLLNGEGISAEPAVIINKDNSYNVDIFIPSKLVDTTLLEDILDYIIPAGMTYNIVNSLRTDDNDTVTYIRSGQDTYEESIYSTTANIEQSKDPINYIPKYDDQETNYTNKIGPGMIDNITVTTLEPEDGESGD